MTHFHPSSTTRSRLSVHLEALGLNTKIVELLKDVKVENVAEEKLKSVDVLRGYLESECNLDPKILNEVISKAQEIGVPQTTSDETNNGSTPDTIAVDTAQEIKDVRRFKAGLLVSSGVHPFKQVAEFEETDAKL